MGRTKEQGITYEERIKVRLDGKHIGDIKVTQIPECSKKHNSYSITNQIAVVYYQYFPKGSKVGGEVFDSLEKCKRTLEARA